MPTPKPAGREGEGLSPLVRRSLVLGAAVFLLDQVSKWAVLYGLGFTAGLPEEHRLEVTPFLNLVMVWNRGISYGLFPADTHFERWILVFLSLGLVGLLGWWLTQVRDKLLASAIGLIIGGALGNVVDRVAYGAVADFFQLHAFGYSWYVFNVADTAIVFGVLMMVWDLIRGDEGARAGPSGGKGWSGAGPSAGGRAEPGPDGRQELAPQLGHGPGLQPGPEAAGRRIIAQEERRNSGSQEEPQ